MTWSRFDDAAPTHPKAKAAGNEAWGLWAAAVMYCNRYLTDGFVTVTALARDCLPVPIKESKAEALAKKLVAAKIRPDGLGLFTEADGGYMVNDFLAWNPSKVDVESKRKSDRDRKRNPTGIAADSKRNPSGVPPDGNGNPSGGQADSGGASPARGPVPAGAHPPVPAIPSQIPATTDPEQLRSCPGDLRLTDDQRKTIETGMIPGWAIDASTLRFVSKAVADPNDLRTLVHWRKCLAIAVSGDWNGPNRPTKPQAGADGQPTMQLPPGVKFGSEGLS